MSANKIGKSFKLYGAAYAQQQVREARDEEERKEVLEQLLDGVEEQGDDEFYGWQGYRVDVKDGSSLFEIYNPGRLFWKKLYNNANLESELRRQRAIGIDLVRVNGRGGIELFRDHSAVWQEVDVDRILPTSYLYKNILLLGEIAAKAGGYIYDAGSVDIDQWLKFRNLPVPQTKAQTLNLIDYLRFDPPVDALGNYWAQLDPVDDALLGLSVEHCQAIRRATAQLLAPGEKLLDVLHLKTAQVAVTQNNASNWTHHVLAHPFAKGLARAYLEKLQWLGSQPGETAADSDLSQLLVTALLLDIDPTIGTVQSRKAIGGQELYAPNNASRHPSAVCSDLRTFFSGKKWVSPALAPVAVHLLLAGVAPELQVKGIPSSLMMGSTEWMNFSRAVKLVESIRPGAARILTYAEITAYAELEPLTEAHTKLRDLTMIDPIVDWALINGVVTSAELASQAKETTERAILRFQAFADGFLMPTKALPSRRLIAKEAIEDAAPLCDFVDDKVLYQRPGLDKSPSAASMVDLHMSGDLVGGEWDRRAVFPDQVYSKTPSLHAGVTNYKPVQYHDPSVKSIYEEFPRLRRLRSVKEELERQVRTYLESINRPLVATVKHALSQMPCDDLQMFMNGKVTLFTFREDASYIHTEKYSALFIPSYTSKSNVETRESRDAVTGRFGLLLCASEGGKTTSYELFTMRGELKKNNWLGNYLGKTGYFDEPARIDFNGNPKALKKPVLKEHLKIDVHKYLHGESSTEGRGDGRAVPEKLAELQAAANSQRLENSAYRNFSNPGVSRLAEFIVSSHPLVKFDELLAAASEQTELEKEREKGEKIATYIIDLVVPFKKCIEDIASGEHNRVADGIYGCMMDAISLGGAFFGAGAKVLSISSKSISAANKAARVAKLVVTSSVSLFNPVDGVPTALYGLGKFVHNGALRFSKSTLELLGLAKSQLDTLHGVTKGPSLIRAADTLSTGHGTWRPISTSTRTLTVLAGRKNFQWYALDRRGRPWGPKLSNFNLVTAGRFPHAAKTMPLSYTKKFVEQSLPRMQIKVDNALTVMTGSRHKSARESLIKMLLGNNSSEAVSTTVDILRLIRADIAGLSMSNILLDENKHTNSIAEFDLDAYQQWKKARGQTSTAFIKICTPSINRQFIENAFNHDVVVDGLIHELFHATAQNNDVGYAVDIGRAAAGGQQLDVTALLNLALGRLPTGESANVYHPSSKALANADSLSVLTALLSQMTSDPTVFESNVQALRAGVAGSGGGTIAGPVVIRLNTAPTPDLSESLLAPGWKRL